MPAGPEEPISLEDIAWRIGASEVRPAHYDEEEAAALAAASTVGIGTEAVARPVKGAPGGAPRGGGPNAAPGVDGPSAAGPSVLQPRPLERPAHTVRRTVRATTGFADHARPGGGRRRAILWRDVSALLFAVMAVALIVQLAQPRSGQVANAIATPRTTAAGTDVAIGSPGAGESVMPTIGGVIDPSLIPIINATPTPVPTPTPTLAPGATLRPTPRPTPRGPQPTPYVLPTTPPHPAPTPTPGPGPTPPPLTPAPTAPPPTPAPTPAPTDTPAPTPAPPTVSLSCPAPTGPSVTCSVTTDADPVTVVWSMGGTGTVNAGGDGFATITFTYDTAGTTYTVVVTVTGPGGSSSDSTQVVVP